MAGPNEGAQFEPSEWRFSSGKSGTPDCEDVVFKLKGFNLSMPLKSRLPDGSLQPGPAGVELNLSMRHTEVVDKGSRGVILEKVTTGKDGIANFAQIDSNHLGNFLEVWYKNDKTETQIRGNKA
jgi:hypothetical protein